jgi:hypothetical protein
MGIVVHGSDMAVPFPVEEGASADLTMIGDQYRMRSAIDQRIV